MGVGRKGRVRRGGSGRPAGSRAPTHLEAVGVLWRGRAKILRAVKLGRLLRDGEASAVGGQLDGVVGHLEVALEEAVVARLACAALMLLLRVIVHVGGNMLVERDAAKVLANGVEDRDHDDDGEGQQNGHEVVEVPQVVQEVRPKLAPFRVVVVMFLVKVVMVVVGVIIRVIVGEVGIVIGVSFVVSGVVSVVVVDVVVVMMVLVMADPHDLLVDVVEEDGRADERHDGLAELGPEREVHALSVGQAEVDLAKGRRGPGEIAEQLRVAGRGE